MVSILPWLLWLTSAAVTSLASADLLLLERQKKWITNRATDFWNWLDDQREFNYLTRLHKFGWQKFVILFYAVITLAGTVGVGILLYCGAFDDDPTIPKNFPYFLLGVYTGSFLTAFFSVRILLPRVLNWITKTAGSWAYIGRSTAVAVATIAVFYATGYADSLWLPQRTLHPADFMDFINSFPSPAFATAYSAYAGFMDILVLVMMMSWMLVVIPVTFVLLLIIFFRVAQFVAVRVAENPKGPQYALGVLLAGVGAGVKLLTQLLVA
jgi:hypothetical protein